MGLETLQDECLIIDGLLLDNLDKVLIDLVIVDGAQCSNLPCLSLSLALKTSYLFVDRLVLHVLKLEVDQRAQQSVIVFSIERFHGFRML